MCAHVLYVRGRACALIGPGQPRVRTLSCIAVNIIIITIIMHLIIAIIIAMHA